MGRTSLTLSFCSYLIISWLTSETYRLINIKSMVNEIYVVPQVEIIEVEVEKGFASSPVLENPEIGDEEGM